MRADERRARLQSARLYLCTSIRPDLESFLGAVLAGGVDAVQLRDKQAPAPALAKAAEIFRTAAERHGSLFIVNDDPNLAAACGADGVHLGQEDMPPEAARKLLGDDVLIGRSTHAPEELERALFEPVDYLGVGPVHPTPTKEGREGVGLEYVRFAAERSTLPFFVTGGMNARTVSDVVLAGATRIVVVRALTEAPDPGAAAKELRALLP